MLMEKTDQKITHYDFASRAVPGDLLNLYDDHGYKIMAVQFYQAVEFSSSVNVLDMDFKR